MCRRVPASSRFVQAQFSAREISSTSLHGRTPLVHGFVPTCNSVSAPLGSHSLNLSSDEPQGFGCEFSLEAFAAPLFVAIFLLLSTLQSGSGSGIAIGSG